jgi:predicted metal-dependent hydrolase
MMKKITVNDLVIEVTRKRIKNLNMRIHPPDGRVSVSVPLRADDEAVRQWVLTKWDWIQRQQAKLATLPQPAALQFTSGESHLFQGRACTLNVIPHSGRAKVVLRDGNQLDLYAAPESDAAYRERVLAAWYRKELQGVIPPLLAYWEPIVGVQSAEWGIKQMKTRWGTCNIQARRIWLNLELMKKPPRCLEYVVVHELVHLLERYHNARFWGFMDRFYPNWRAVRAELNYGIPEGDDAC